MRISLRQSLYLWGPVVLVAGGILLEMHGLHPLHIGTLGGDPIGPGPPD